MECVGTHIAENIGKILMMIFDHNWKVLVLVIAENIRKILIL